MVLTFEKTDLISDGDELWELILARERGGHRISNQGHPFSSDQVNRRPSTDGMVDQMFLLAQDIFKFLLSNGFWSGYQFQK